MASSVELNESSPAASPRRTGVWLSSAAALFRERLDDLSDAALDEPARLAGWSRRHVVGHLHYNALILGRLARSVAVGAPETLDSPVDRWHSWRARSEQMPARHLRDLMRWAEEDLETAFGELDRAVRSGRVAEVPGLRVPADDLPWMRIRELVIHLPDLDPAVDLGRLPGDLMRRLGSDLFGVPQGDAGRAIRWILEPGSVRRADGEVMYSLCVPVISPRQP